MYQLQLGLGQLYLLVIKCHIFVFGRFPDSGRWGGVERAGAEHLPIRSLRNGPVGFNVGRSYTVETEMSVHDLGCSIFLRTGHRATGCR